MGWRRPDGASLSTHSHLSTSGETRHTEFRLTTLAVAVRLGATPALDRLGGSKHVIEQAHLDPHWL
jgi:hypothetical protein